MGNGGAVVSGAPGASRNAESSAEKKSVIFPSQFHEIAADLRRFKSQTPVKVDGTPYVSYDDLRHESRVAL